VAKLGRKSLLFFPFIGYDGKNKFFCASDSLCLLTLRALPMFVLLLLIVKQATRLGGQSPKTHGTNKEDVELLVKA